MISAEVIKGVQELLEKRGEEPRPGERLSDFVARGLHLTPAQTEHLLSALHDGADVDDAAAQAGVAPSAVDQDLLQQIARAIGATLGKVAGASSQKFV